MMSDCKNGKLNPGDFCARFRVFHFSGQPASPRARVPGQFPQPCLTGVLRPGAKTRATEGANLLTGDNSQFARLPRTEEPRGLWAAPKRAGKRSPRFGECRSQNKDPVPTRTWGLERMRPTPHLSPSLKFQTLTDRRQGLNPFGYAKGAISRCLNFLQKPMIMPMNRQ